MTRDPGFSRRDQMVIDDFVVERIRAGHLDVFEAQQAFGTERLARLEREDRIVAMGDRYDAYYDVPAGDR